MTSHLWSLIPLGATGKVDKKVLRRQFVEEAQNRAAPVLVNRADIKMPIPPAPVEQKVQKKRWLPW